MRPNLRPAGATARLALPAAALLAVAAAAPLAPDAVAASFCNQTARHALRACRAGAGEDFWNAMAACTNERNARVRRACKRDVRRERRAARAGCNEVRRERREVCAIVGGGRYDPPLRARDFVDPLRIGRSVAPNRYFPLVRGTRWTYRAEFVDDGEAVTEIIRVEVTERTKQIAGITAVVVTDRVFEDGALIEDTDDWYAQDRRGNVWYLGEVSRNFESFDGDDPADPELVDLDGSWKTGRDRARPGILIRADPRPGDGHWQEVLINEAEDYVRYVAVDGSATTPAASCDGDCLVTLDGTPLEPGVLETKLYAPGVGLILEVDPDGNRVELVRFRRP